LGHALANFIALIGWAPGEDREVMSMDEMAEAFSIRGIQPSPGVFDPAKLDWLSGMHMRRLPAEELFSMVADYASRSESQDYWKEKDPAVAGALATLAGAATEAPDLARRAVELEQERVTNLAAMGPATEFFFVDEPEFDEKAVKKWAGQPHVPAMFDAFIAELQGKETADEAVMEAMVKGWAEANGFDKLGPVVHPTRVALTGKTVGPGLWELMAALGPAAVCRRLLRGKEALA
jgi:glutamyl-tRNA synthetase